jgi:phage terminase small subunit
LFCREYCQDFNAKQAAIRAGYSAKTARVIGPENLSKPDIQQKISELVGGILQKLEISVKSVVNEIAAVAFVDPGELFDAKGNLKKVGDLNPKVRRAIRSVEVSGEEFGPTTRIRLWDKLKALEMLLRHLTLSGGEKASEAPRQVDIAQVIQRIQSMSTADLLAESERRLREIRQKNRER